MPETQDQDQVFEAPQLHFPKVEDDPWRRDEQVFFQKLPELLKTFRGKWIAIHNGEVVEVGDTRRQVLLQFLEKFPNDEVYIQLVDEEIPMLKMYSPRKRLRRA